MSEHHFYHGDFGWNVNTKTGIVDWDGDEGEGIPTEDDVEAASEYWDEEGYNEYLSEREHEIADMKYERWRDDRMMGDML